MGPERSFVCRGEARGARARGGVRAPAGAAPVARAASAGRSCAMSAPRSPRPRATPRRADDAPTERSKRSERARLPNAARKQTRLHL